MEKYLEVYRCVGGQSGRHAVTDCDTFIVRTSHLSAGALDSSSLNHNEQNGGFLNQTWRHGAW